MGRARFDGGGVGCTAMSPHRPPCRSQTSLGTPDGARRPRPGSLVRWSAAAVACGGLTGCAGLVKQAATTAVPIVVSSGLGELATPQSQAQLKSIAASPAVQEAGYGVGLGIGRGILDEGSAFLGGAPAKSDEPPTAVGVAANTNGAAGAPPTAGAPTTRPVAAGGTGPADRAPATTAPANGSAPAATQAAGKPSGLATLQANLSPFFGQTVRSVVTAGMEQASGPQQRAQVRALAESAGEGVVTGMTRSAERDIVPSLKRLTGPDAQAQVRTLAETAGEAVVAGMTRSAERDGVPALQRIVRDKLNPGMTADLSASLSAAFDDAVRHHLGPALHDVLQEQVAPVVRQLVAESAQDTLAMPVRPENAPNVVANAHNVSLGASQTTHDALINVGVVEPDGRWSLHLRLVLWSAGILIALIGLAALALLTLHVMIAWSKWRRPAAP